LPQLGQAWVLGAQRTTGMFGTSMACVPSGNGGKVPFS
jgi:hypothetical protein